MGNFVAFSKIRCLTQLNEELSYIWFGLKISQGNFLIHSLLKMSPWGKLLEQFARN